MAFCQNCGKELAEGARFCDGCGKAVGAATEEGAKRSQKFLGGGVQYKCPSCGAVVSRTTRKCPDCGYKIDFQAQSKSVQKFLEYEKNHSLEEALEEFDFPLEIQELLELAIFAQTRLEGDKDYDDFRTMWFNFINRIYGKASLMVDDKEIVDKISKIKDNAKETVDKCEKEEKKSEHKSKIVFIIILLLIVLSIGYCTVGKKFVANREIQKIEESIDAALEAKDYAKAERLLLEYKPNKKLSKEQNAEIEGKKEFFMKKLQEEK